MKEIILGTEVNIRNCKILDPTYINEFHEFKDENRNILTVYLLIPGIKPESMQIETRNNNLKIKAYIRKPYRAIYKSQQILISGKISQSVLSNVYGSKYEDGILQIELALKRE